MKYSPEKSTFEIFLSELAKVVHLSHLKPDSHDTCFLLWKEGEIPLLFEFDDQLVPNTILLSAEIAPIPLDYQQEVFETALKENSLSEETLSVKPDEDMLFLHRRFHPFISAEEMDSLLKPFIEKVKQWRSKLKDISQKPPQFSSKPPHPSSIQVFPYKA